MMEIIHSFSHDELAMPHLVCQIIPYLFSKELQSLGITRDDYASWLNSPQLYPEMTARFSTYLIDHYQPGYQPHDALKTVEVKCHGGEPTMIYLVNTRLEVYELILFILMEKYIEKAADRYELQLHGQTLQYTSLLSDIIGKHDKISLTLVNKNGMEDGNCCVIL